MKRFLKLRNLEQLQVVCLDGVGTWRTEWDITMAAEGKDKVVLLDKNEDDEKNGLYLSRVGDDLVVMEPTKKTYQVSSEATLS